MSSTEEQPLRTYRGNCHCTAFVYEIKVPEIKAVKQCNCSICHKKGYLWVFPSAAEHFQVVKGTEDDLTNYTFNDGNIIHKFCPTCATPVMGRALKAPAGVSAAINVHGLQDFDTWEVTKEPVDYAKVGEPYKVPEHKGPLPTAEIEGGKMYKGGCHCGAVTLAVLSKPLDETYEEGGLTCNCSICERNGYFWAYPRNEQVVLHAEDPSNIGRYQFARHLLRKTFCKVCGVNLTNEYNADMTQEQKDKLVDGAKRYETYALEHHPFNLRTLPGLDLSKLKERKNRGLTGIPGTYVNP